VSLFKDKIEQGWVNTCAVSYLYHSTCVHSALFNLVFEQWHGGCPLCSRTFLPLSQHMSSLSLVQSCLWTVTRCVPLVQQKILTFIIAHEFTQPCSILSLNSVTMGAPSAADISYLYQSTWVHSALFLNSCALKKVRNFSCTRSTHRVTVQRQDRTRLSELMCSDKGKKCLLH
jgi:hypothetical protein